LLGPTGESTAQTLSHSVQPFSEQVRVVTNRQTDAHRPRNIANIRPLLAMRCGLRSKALSVRAFQFGQKSFDSIRFGNLINLPLVH